MVDARTTRESDREALVRDLRRKLEASTDATVRAALEQAIAGLQSSSETLEAGAAVRRRIAAALASAGLAGESQELDLAENALRVLEHRYFLKDDDGHPVEDAAGMFRRVAKAIAQIDRMYDPNADTQAVEETFYRSMARLEFLPNSPTLMNAGTNAGTLSACFVLPLEDSMEDIMRTASEIAMVQKYGGGTGVALSRLRPKGEGIRTTHGKACGPVAVLRHLSSVSTMITQGGKRDGANMAVMDVHHPDLMDFVTSKHQEGLIHNYNISVGVDDAFMEAVERGGSLVLRGSIAQGNGNSVRWDPDTGEEVTDLDARKVFSEIVSGAWRNGEPGMIFLDRVNRDNPTPHIGRITATNPCGEQPLLPYESCNLGSIVLSRMLRLSAPSDPASDGGAEVDWAKLRETVRIAVHFLDNVIDANRYSVPEIERMTKLTRKIGLGVMGFADMLVRLGIPYDSEEGLALGGEVMRVIKEESDDASRELALSRGVFPAFPGSRHDDGNPAHRFRNSCRLTVAPTGTISMIAGCSSGIEPLFALAYRKHNILDGQTLYYVDSAFEAVARHEGFYSEDLAEALAQGHSLAEQEDVPQWASAVFATAPDIAPEWHVRMQAAFQDHTDAAISKTINFPNEATEEDVRQAYTLAWKLGCKGITVYRAGSREKEVLTAGTVRKDAEDTRESLSEGAGGAAAPVPSAIPLATFEPGRIGGLHMRQRPQMVRGVTERVRTGHGNIFITTNFDEEERPFEVFTSLGKAGSSDSAQLEAIARLVSMALRVGVDPEEIVGQLRGITDEPVWDNGVLVRSAPDALALALGRALGLERGGPYGEQLGLFGPGAVKATEKAVRESAHNGGANGGGRAGWGTCPQCPGPLVYQEGCLMCRECGYNKCG